MKKILMLIFFVLATIGTVFCSPNWTVTFVGQTNTLRGIQFIDNNTGFVVGTNVFLKTTNAGTNWSVSTSRYDFSGVYFLDAQTGFATGTTVDSAFVLKTTNGGGSWSSNVNFPSGSFEYGNLYFKDNNTGYVIQPALNGGYYRTTNSGLYWVLKYFSYEYTSDVKWIGNLFYRVGSTPIQGYMKPAYWTSTDEINWSGTNFCAECNNNEYGISYYHYDTVDYLVTNQGLWRKTIPHQFWQEVAYDGYGILYSFTNETNIHHGNSYNSICYLYASSNAGYSWIADTLQDFTIKNLYFTNQSTGFAVGSNGLIAKTTNGGGTIGIETISSEVPKQFSLSQNYPNPFNPSTQIEFSVPKNKTIVKLTVFDITGRKIETLVDQELSSGTYKVEFQGDSYSSGMYFYRLETNNFQQTRKMILIK